jgi:hypothetical protein
MDATQDLAAFPLQIILKALKDHPEGVSPGYFKKLKVEGIDLTNHKQVGQAMKNSPHPIIYRKDLNQYHLLSTAHKTALKSYEPIVSNSFWR